jgi:hypothetical protein
VTLDDDLRALAAMVDDPAEGDALLALFALVEQVVVEEEPEDVYAPFVYPH